MDVASLPLFCVLEPDERKALLKITNKRRFKQGDIIVKEGEAGDSLFIFVEGEVEVSSQLTLDLGGGKVGETEKSMARIKAQQMGIFGEMSLLTGAPRSATIRALKKCVLLEIKRDKLKEFCAKYPQAGWKILWEIGVILSNRLRRSNDSILKLTTALSIALSQK